MAKPKKRQKTYRHVVKRTRMVSKWDSFFTPVTSQKSQTNIYSPKWTPGTSLDPKGIQKASKRCPKGVQKASKLIQIRPHWNQNSKIPMQRTAENHAPYQSYSSEQKSQHVQRRPQLASGLLTFVSVLLSDMQAFSMSTFHAGVQV